MFIAASPTIVVMRGTGQALAIKLRAKDQELEKQRIKARRSLVGGWEEPPGEGSTLLDRPNNTPNLISEERGGEKEVLLVPREPSFATRRTGSFFEDGISEGVEMEQVEPVRPPRSRRFDWSPLMGTSQTDHGSYRRGSTPEQRVTAKPALVRKVSFNSVPSVHTGQSPLKTILSSDLPGDLTEPLLSSHQQDEEDLAPTPTTVDASPPPRPTNVSFPGEVQVEDADGPHIRFRDRSSDIPPEEERSGSTGPRPADDRRTSVDAHEKRSMFQRVRGHALFSKFMSSGSKEEVGSEEADEEVEDAALEEFGVDIEGDGQEEQHHHPVVVLPTTSVVTSSAGLGRAHVGLLPTTTSSSPHHRPPMPDKNLVVVRDPRTGVLRTEVKMPEPGDLERDPNSVRSQVG